MGVREDAIDELVAFSGCTEGRATALVDAVRDTAVSGTLGLITGTVAAASSMTEHRLSRLDALTRTKGIGKLNVEEIAGVFRITIGQARSLDRTYAARFPRLVETGLNDRLGRMEPESTGVADVAGWELDFSDSELREHALRKLRRHQVEKNVEAPKDSLKLRFPKEAVNANGDEVDTLTVLGIDP